MAFEADPISGSTSLVTLTTAQSVQTREVWQLPDGRAAFNNGGAASSGASRTFKADGKVVVPKEASVVFLDGQPLYWDTSASVATYRKVQDRDFYLGRCFGDTASTDTQCTVVLNLDVPYDRDLLRDPFTTAITGTQALGGLGLYHRGGALLLVLDSTSEAQKVDALGVDGFDPGSNAIIEGNFRILSDGSGSAPDISIGVANGTHATDADSITEHFFLHLDGNATAIKAQSKDTGTTVAATDTTKVYAEGATVACRVHFMLDLRTLTDCRAYINGVRVLSSTAFKLNAATGPLFLLVHVEKTSATDTYQLAIDSLKARFSEQ